MIVLKNIKLAKWHRCSECDKLRVKSNFSIFNEEHSYFLCNICKDRQYREAHQSMNYEYKKQKESDNLVLSELKKITSKESYQDILDYIKDCEGGTDFEFIINPYGDYQEEPYSFKGAWINQSCGMCGDDYSGTIIIKIKEDKYFSFYFAM